MQRYAEETVSVWDTYNQYIPSSTMLLKDISTDVCVVGAGIAGLTTAYLLQREGKSVIVVEAREIASGETGRTTAHLTAVLDDRFFNLEAKFGLENARLAAQSHKAAINKIESIIKTENIDCDFERLNGYLVALTDQEHEDFKKEWVAAKRVGFSDMTIHTCTPILGVHNTGPTLCFPNQATFNIIKYISALANIIQKNGGQIYTNTRVNKVKGGKTAYISTENGFNVYANSIVVATNTPINAKVTIHTKQAAYRTYAVGFEIEKNSYPNFLLWDLKDPYHYVRILHQAEHDLLIVGGEDHKTGQKNDNEQRYKNLENWTREHFSIMGPVKYRWSGQIIEPIDHLAFIGRNPHDDKNVYIVTSDSGHGMTHSTIAGILLTDLICNRQNSWETLYDPSRITFKAISSFIKENVNTIGHMIKDKLRFGVSTIDDIKPGQGAIINRGFKKIAVYRDEAGKLHERSASCPHMGCIVRWNSNETSWDCPCHGSRFSCYGQVLNGPATKSLSGKRS